MAALSKPKSQEVEDAVRALVRGVLDDSARAADRAPAPIASSSSINHLPRPQPKPLSHPPDPHRVVLSSPPLRRSIASSAASRPRAPRRARRPISRAWRRSRCTRRPTSTSSARASRCRGSTSSRSSCGACAWATTRAPWSTGRSCSATCRSTTGRTSCRCPHATRSTRTMIPREWAGEGSQVGRGLEKRGIGGKANGGIFVLGFLTL